MSRRGSTFSERIHFEKQANFPTDIGSFNIGCKLASSHFDGSTFLLTKRADISEDKLYVTRKIDAEKLTTKDLQLIQDELNILNRLDHPNITKFFSCFVISEGFILTVYPLSNYGSCHDIIGAHFKNGLPSLLVGIILRSVVLALEHLHSLKIVHRAVKASHILLDSDGSVCLTGLRYCKQLPCDQQICHSFPDHGLHMLAWIAPEILRQNLSGYGTSSDIYSLGITAVELITGTIPYSKLRPTEVLLQKLKGVVPQLPDSATIEEMHCDLSSSNTSLDGLEQTNDMMSVGSSASICSNSKRIRNLQQFVDICLNTDPLQRPIACHLKSSPYLKHVKSKLKNKLLPSFSEQLKDVQPINQFIPYDHDCSSEMEQVMQKVPSVTLNDEGNGQQDQWVF